MLTPAPIDVETPRRFTHDHAAAGGGAELGKIGGGAARGGRIDADGGGRRAVLAAMGLDGSDRDLQELRRAQFDFGAGGQPEIAERLLPNIREDVTRAGEIPQLATAAHALIFRSDKLKFDDFGLNCQPFS